MYALSITTANAHNLELFLNTAQVTVTAQGRVGSCRIAWAVTVTWIRLLFAPWPINYFIYT